MREGVVDADVRKCCCVLTRIVLGAITGRDEQGDGAVLVQFEEAVVGREVDVTRCVRRDGTYRAHL